MNFVYWYEILRDLCPFFILPRPPSRAMSRKEIFLSTFCSYFVSPMISFYSLNLFMITLVVFLQCYFCKIFYVKSFFVHFKTDKTSELFVIHRKTFLVLPISLFLTPFFLPPHFSLSQLQPTNGFYVIVQIRDGGLYRDFKSRVLFEKACLFNARGIWNPGKVRRRVFELTSQSGNLHISKVLGL